MPINVLCPTCGKQYLVDDRLAGKRGKCKECGAVLVVPQAIVNAVSPPARSAAPSGRATTPPARLGTPRVGGIERPSAPEANASERLGAPVELPESGLNSRLPVPQPRGRGEGPGRPAVPSNTLSFQPVDENASFAPVAAPSQRLPALAWVGIGTVALAVAGVAAYPFILERQKTRTIFPPVVETRAEPPAAPSAPPRASPAPAPPKPAAPSRRPPAPPDPLAALDTAVKGGDIAAIGRVLDANPKLLNAQRSFDARRWPAPTDGQAPLHVAVTEAKLDAAKVLLDRGADPNIVDRTGRTPLHYAAGRDLKGMIELLLAHKADPNAPMRPGPGIPIVPHFGAEDVWLNYVCSTHPGYTPLHVAAGMYESYQGKALLAAGAEVNAIGKDGYTPLHVAAEFPSADGTGYLRAIGDLANATPGVTPAQLRSLSHTLQPWSVGWFLPKGAAPDIFVEVGLSGGKGSTDKGGLATMLSANPRLVSARDGQGHTPLHYAAGATLEALQTVLDAGGDVKAADKNGRTPLHYAAYWDDVKGSNTRLLIGKGADVNARDAAGVTPLHWARTTGAIQALADAGANVNVRDDHGLTPLHYACLYGRDDLIKALLDRKADANAAGSLDVLGDKPDTTKRVSGLTPLHLQACAVSRSTSIKLLKAAGANIRAKDSLGRTAGDLCNQRGEQQLSGMFK